MAVKSATTEKWEGAAQTAKASALTSHAQVAISLLLLIALAWKDISLQVNSACRFAEMAKWLGRKDVMIS